MLAQTHCLIPINYITCETSEWPLEGQSFQTHPQTVHFISSTQTSTEHLNTEQTYTPDTAERQPRITPELERKEKKNLNISELIVLLLF